MREGEKKHTSRKVVRLFQKRWVFPTVYIVCAAIILTAALWYQAVNKDQDGNQATPFGQTEKETPAVPVSKPTELVKMPVVDASKAVVKKKFYDDTASEKEQENALVFYNNTYMPSTGIDIAAEDGKSFEVVAALSGTVLKAEKDPLLGYVVEIDSGNGVVSFYQSLGDLKVESGDMVVQGDVLGTAGLSEVNKQAGYHVHYELRKDGTAVNPETYLEKPVGQVKVEQQKAAGDDNKDPKQDGDKQNSTTPDKGDEKEPAKDEKQQKDEDKPSDDKEKQKSSDEDSAN
ncbi:M23 family metallopeptidase [Bacillus sp. 165]|uniref:M23 family metallopeptidase n=1 Tax=Bacillus sp. 165 TaxID=1529117 RepID=UPI001ADB99B6|nr:M23 family metallopeptidase [Bacillus sp. 165]MBO9130040.1 M23 family metallopeptidase [Bacillus sp. 165]